MMSRLRRNVLKSKNNFPAEHRQACPQGTRVDALYDVFQPGSDSHMTVPDALPAAKGIPQKQRRVMLLQGLMGPFFRQLGKGLHKAGHEVFKVNSTAVMACSGPRQRRPIPLPLRRSAGF